MAALAGTAGVGATGTGGNGGTTGAQSGAGGTGGIAGMSGVAGAGGMAAILCGPNAQELCYEASLDLLCEPATSPTLAAVLGDPLTQLQNFCSISCLMNEAYQPISPARKRVATPWPPTSAKAARCSSKASPAWPRRRPAKTGRYHR
jgi:hypothetical protein